MGKLTPAPSEWPHKSRMQKLDSWLEEVMNFYSELSLMTNYQVNIPNTALTINLDSHKCTRVPDPSLPEHQSKARASEGLLS